MRCKPAADFRAAHGAALLYKVLRVQLTTVGTRFTAKPMPTLMICRATSKQAGLNG